MKSLEAQYKEDMIVWTDYEVLWAALEVLGIEERGGGPEGLYYTHAKVEGEFLRRNLLLLIEKLRPKGNDVAIL